MAAIIIIMIRVILNYILMFITFRLMGKREVGELSLIDLIVFLMIAELAALSIEATDKPYYLTIIAVGILVCLQRLLAQLTLKKAKLRTKIEGKPSVIIANGKINYQEMRKCRYSFDDLIAQLREKGIKSISEVEYAILEVNGTLSTFKYEEDCKFVSPLPLVLSGEIIKENFQYVDLDEATFCTLLTEKGYAKLSEVMYANYEDGEIFIIAAEKN